jgi:hypothetical protein
MSAGAASLLTLVAASIGTTSKHSRCTVLANPNPTELEKLVDPETVAEHRSLFCAHYDDCLEHAVNCAWYSWSCEQCLLYTLRHEMAAQYARAHHHHVHEAGSVVAT